MAYGGGKGGGMASWEALLCWLWSTRAVREAFFGVGRGSPVDPSIGALHYFSGLQQGLGDETKKGRLGSGKGDGVRWVSLVRSQAIPPPPGVCADLGGSQSPKGPS